jgi:hypothetical protein
VLPAESVWPQPTTAAKSTAEMKHFPSMDRPFL